MKRRNLSLSDRFFALSLLSGLSACGGASTFQAQYAAFGVDIDNVPSGTVFTVSGKKRDALTGRVPIVGSSVTFEGKYVSNTKIELSYDGKTIPLTYNADRQNFAGSLAKRLNPDDTSDVENTDVSLFLTDLNPYAKKVQFTTQEGFNGSTFPKDRVTGVVGFFTDPQALPTSATYTGVSEITAGSFGGRDSATGEVVPNADFAAGTIDGSMSFTDPLGDTTSAAPFDLDTFMLVMSSGTIDGNEFSANLAFAGATGSLDGGFYGPTGEHAAGIALIGSPLNSIYTSITVTADR